ncbi:trypsin-like peptidase domain-containing protein [Streptomyces sp. TRM 70351]|uniref:S1C family serine protease n=1 Tax=Streptomyces sp. TRM 70351 TaxID=3116552 RepID=UPI002E7AC34F|nr:trypsin-like peptidase domain-containing protein [Streptomyces sp. TRM 70351]MEE1930173.1 trypsin-like peptidase domain-containing protein [Streptomyces sp. TRM 70351]
MSTEHEGVDRSPEERRAADETAPGDRVPPVAPPEEPQHRPSGGDDTARLRAVDPQAAPPPRPAAPPAPVAPPAPAPAPDQGSAEAPGTPDGAAAQEHPAGAPESPGAPAASGAAAPGGYGDPPAAHTAAHSGQGGGYGDHTGGYGGQGGFGGHTGGYGGAAQPWGAPPPPPKKKGRGGFVAALIAGALVTGAVGGGIGFWAADHNATPASETVKSSASGQETVQRAPDSVAGIAAKALPSTVTIQVNGGSGRSGGGTGTGFVFDRQGHILTNNHVVASAAQGADLSVVFSDGKQYDGEVVGRAEGYDIAVIKLTDPEGATLTPLPLGESGQVAVGDSTIAIGAPFGLSGTVTTGIVSALNRPVASSDAEGSSASYMSALQTDASINPGNSGGPLLNAEGEVIGVNSAIQSTSDGALGGPAGSIGLGFAIPIDQAKRVAQTLIQRGEPVYPIIGATVEMNQSNDGATISEGGANGTEALTPGGPADEAGLQPGDVITKFNGTAIDSGPTLISEIWTHQPGDRVTLTYERGGQENQVELTLGERVGDD